MKKFSDSVSHILRVNMQKLPILNAFTNLSAPRRRAGLRHQKLLELFKPEKNRLPSISTIRRVLLQTDEPEYAQCLSCIFPITPVKTTI